MALFDQRDPKFLIRSTLVDDLLYFLVILPSFVIGLRFWTAPVYLKYTLKMNGALVPLISCAPFLATHFDILLLGILVTMMNLYVFWYHIDPPREEYAGGRYTTRRNDDFTPEYGVTEMVSSYGRFM